MFPSHLLKTPTTTSGDLDRTATDIEGARLLLTLQRDQVRSSQSTTQSALRHHRGQSDSPDEVLFNFRGQTADSQHAASTQLLRPDVQTPYPRRGSTPTDRQLGQPATQLFKSLPVRQLTIELLN